MAADRDLDRIKSLSKVTDRYKITLYSEAGLLSVISMHTIRYEAAPPSATSTCEDIDVQRFRSGPMHACGMKGILIVCAFWISHSCVAQWKAPVYKYSFSENKQILLGSMAFYAGISIYDATRKVELLDDPEDVDINRLWHFDRHATEQHSKSAKKVSDILLYSSAAPLFLMAALNRSHQQRSGPILLMALEGFLIQDGINKSAKLLFERPRPFIYREGDAILNQAISKNDTKSFYSGHTSTVAYFSFFSAKVFSDLYPESRWRLPVWTLAATLPAITGYSRYRAGKHFPTDIAVGYIMGAGIGLLLPCIHKGDELQLTGSANGFSLRYSF